MESANKNGQPARPRLPALFFLGPLVFRSIKYVRRFLWIVRAYLRKQDTGNVVSWELKGRSQ
jgi:hypothetical protein